MAPGKKVTIKRRPRRSLRKTEKGGKKKSARPPPYRRSSLRRAGEREKKSSINEKRKGGEPADVQKRFLLLVAEGRKASAAVTLLDYVGKEGKNASLFHQQDPAAPMVWKERFCG